MPPGSFINGLPVYNKVANFYIGRTERIRLVGWNPALKRLDHADFFTRALGILTTVFNPNLKCLHAQTPCHKKINPQYFTYFQVIIPHENLLFKKR